MNATGRPVTLRTNAIGAGQVEEHELETAESVIVILGGRCDVDFAPGGPAWYDLGSRTDVFDGRATACYVPAGLRARITGRSAGVRYAVVSAPVPRSFAAPEPYVVLPGDIEPETRGSGVWEREVHDIVGPAQPAGGLLVGETFSAGGVWSSYPPHKHDSHDPPHESCQQEAFLVRVAPPSGFGVFVHYPSTAHERQSTIVEDGTVVTVTEGFHSFVAAAGHRFYYLWALAGSERELRFRTDPRHEWLLAETSRQPA
jgi:5-deoxy-glucuronate isomerase